MGGTNGGADTLSVKVNNVTYTTSNGLTINDKTWSVVLNSSSLAAGNTYDVIASVIRSGSAAVTDATVGELTIVSGPVVDITGAATASTSSSKPILGGTSTPGAVVTLQIDLDNNNSTTNDRVTYSVVADGSGNWSINLATATPISGTLPVSGLSGTVGLLATVTDSSNHIATDTQALTITVPSISISSVTGALPVTSGISNDGILNGTEDNASVIYINATNIATNQTIAVTVSDGVHSNVTGVASYDAVSGKWKTTLDLSSLNDGTNALNILASFNSGQATATTQVSHDSEAYASVTSEETTSATLLINGKADVTSNSLVIKVDRYTKQGNSILFNNTTYYSVAGGTIGSYSTVSGVSLTGNGWSLPSNQSGGSFNNPGEYILVTVIGTDAAGNTVNATGQVTQIANNGTPNTVSISTIAGDNIINESEDNSVSISGTTTVSGGYILVTLTDGSNSISQQVQATGTSWSLSNLNLDNWKDGPIQVEAKLLSASNSTTVVASALATPTHVNSVTAAPTIAISNPIGDGNLSANEDSSVTVSGTTTNAVGATVTVTIGGTKIGTATVASNGTWSTTFDSGHSNALSSLADGTLNVSASVTANSSTATDSTTVLHDRTPPVVSIAPLLTTGKPTIQGTTDLTAGSIISVTIDPDNNSGTSDTVTYQATVLNGGTWSIDLSSATPITGSLSQAGLTAYAKITASGTDAAGNSTTTTALDKPVVNTKLTNSGSPTLTGTWTYIAGDVLSVTVANSGNAVSHTYTAGDGHLVANSNNTWTLIIPSADTLPADTYNVTATVTRNAATASDTTSAELVVDTSAPSIDITNISNDSGSSATDYITNDNSLVFSGTAETNANVLVTLKDAANNTIFSTTVVATGGVWSIDRNGQATLSDGNYTLTATATDAAGNSAIDTQYIVIDTKATIGITTNYSSATATPIITGSSDLGANQNINVSISGATYAVQTQSDGSWNIDLATAIPSSGSLTPLTDGNTYTITASGSDLAGNNATTSKAIHIDTSAPSIKITSPLDWNGNSNSTLTITEDTDVIIKGSSSKGASTVALAGSTVAVTITDGNITISDTATVLSDGSWQLAPLNLRSMASGNITVNATYIDNSGIAYTDIATILHDKTATVSIDSISNDTGIQGDFVTADNTLVFSGSATPNSTVTLNLTGPSHTFSNVTVTANSNGVWSYDYRGTTLTDGDYTLSATVTGTTIAQNIVIDTTIPNGTVTVNPLITNDISPTITGTAVVNSGENLSVTVNGVTYSAGDGDLTYNSSLHTWSLTIPSDATHELSPAVNGGFDGVYSVTATIRDVAGNVLNDNTTRELLIDTTPPVAPTLSLTTDSGSSNSDKLTNVGTLSLSGVETGALVEYSTDGTTWHNSFTAVEGTNTVYARQTDTAGNVSASSAAFTFVRDTTAPTVSIQNAPATHNGNAFTVTLEFNENVTGFAVGDLSVSGASLSNFTALDGNTYVVTLTPLGTGSITLDVPAAVAQDGAGNNNAAATQVTVGYSSIDTTPPTIALSSDLTSLRAGQTATVTFTLSEAATDFDINDIVVSGGTLSNFSGSGTSYSATFTPTASSTADGHISVASGRFTDAAGNANTDGADSNNQLTLSVDTAIPVTPTLALTTDSGSSATDKLTNDGTLSLTGVESGALVEYSTDGTTWHNSFTAVEGTNTVYVRQTDTAGNVSAPSTAFTFVRDTTVPTIALTSNVASLRAGQTATVTFTLSEAATDFDINDIVVSGGTLSNFSGSGTTYTATFTPTASSTADGHISVASSRFTDAAGNANTDGADSNNQLTLSIDTAIPVAPTLSLTTDSGSSNSDKLTNVGTLSLTGVETGALVEYSTNGTDWHNSFTAVEGTNTVYVRQTDTAGNVSAPSAAFTFVRDATNPTNATGVLSIAERSTNGSVVGAISATDNIGPLAYSLRDNAGGRFAIDSNTGTVTVIDGSLLDNQINSSHNITVRVTDAAGNQTDTVMTVTVTAVNRAPVAVNDTAIAREAGGTNNTILGLNPSGNVLANDHDPDSRDSIHVSAVSFSGNNGVVGQAIAGNYGSLTLLSDGNYSYIVNNALPAVQALRSNSDVLTETFTYTLQDAGGLTSTATLTITINGANDAPVASNDNQDANWNFGRDYYKNVSNLFTDADGYGEKLVYSISGLPAGLTFDPASGIISGQPDKVGNFNIIISATDTSGSVVSRSYALTIIAPAQTTIPVITPTPVEIKPSPIVITPTTVEPTVTTTATLPTGVVTTQGHTETSGFLPPANDAPIATNGTVNIETAKDHTGINTTKTDQSAETVSVNVNADGKVVISDIPRQTYDAAGLSIKNVELTNGDIQVYIIDAKPSQNYSATLSDGTALPDWVSIDPTTGALSIKPPAGEKDLIIKIYATDANGAIRILQVKLNVEDLAKQQHVAKISPHTEFIPLEQQFSMETAMIDGYGERIASLLAV